MPDNIITILVCKVPISGYVPDDEIYMSNHQSDPSGGDEGIAVTRHANSQLIQTRIASNGPGESLSKTSGAGIILQSICWKLKQRFVWYGTDASHTKTITSLNVTPV